MNRLGITVASGLISPGFAGKLSLTLRNTAAKPAILRPALPIVHLCLASVDTTVHETSGRDSGQFSDELARWEISLEDIEQQPSTRDSSDRSLVDQLADALSARPERKGKALEQVVADIFGGVTGLEILKRNARLKAEELDLVIKNNLDTGFWRAAGSPVIVECKNWSAAVGAREVSVLVEKLQALSPDARVGILVAVNGVTGDCYRDAILKVREARQRGRYILILERKDLEEMVAGASVTDVTERKYDETLLI